MRITNIEQISPRGPGEVTPQDGGFLGRLDKSLESVKELLNLGKEIKAMEQSGNKAAALGAAVSPGGQWGKFLKILLDKGYGDKPIGEMLAELAPLTIKQLMALAAEERGNDATGKK